MLITAGLARKCVRDLRRTDNDDYGDDIQEFGKQLTPLEEEGRDQYNSWGSLGSAWVDDIINCCRDLNIDGIVQWMQVGCPTTMGLGKVVSDRAENELGILTLNLEGRMIEADAYNPDVDEAKLGEFVELCLTAKESRNRAMVAGSI